MSLKKRLWKLLCRKVTHWTECSYCTPGAVWCGGGGYYEIDINYCIPFWVRDEDAIQNYIDRHEDKDMCYW